MTTLRHITVGPVKMGNGLLLTLIVSACFLCISVLHGTAIAAPHLTAEEIVQLRNEAEAGNSLSQLKLGVLYMEGWSVPQDDAQAIKWQLKAAEQGQPLAEYNIAEAYNNGRGLTKDKTEAMKWYRKAANHGNIRAQLYLSRAYYSGLDGLPKDYVKAYMWLAFSKGAAQAGMRKELEQKMTSGQIAQARQEADEWKKQHPNTPENL